MPARSTTPRPRPSGYNSLATAATTKRRATARCSCTFSRGRRRTFAASLRGGGGGARAACWPRLLGSWRRCAPPLVALLGQAPAPSPSPGRGGTAHGRPPSALAGGSPAGHGTTGSGRRRPGTPASPTTVLRGGGGRAADGRRWPQAGCSGYHAGPVWPYRLQ